MSVVTQFAVDKVPPTIVDFDWTAHRPTLCLSEIKSGGW
jgi:hypothetical protein